LFLPPIAKYRIFYSFFLGTFLSRFGVFLSIDKWSSKTPQKPFNQKIMSILPKQMAPFPHLFISRLWVLLSARARARDGSSKTAPTRPQASSTLQYPRHWHFLIFLSNSQLSTGAVKKKKEKTTYLPTFF
jgi:hypothetical protein